MGTSPRMRASETSNTTPSDAVIDATTGDESVTQTPLLDWHILETH